MVPVVQDSVSFGKPCFLFTSERFQLGSLNTGFQTCSKQGSFVQHQPNNIKQSHRIDALVSCFIGSFSKAFVPERLLEKG